MGDPVSAISQSGVFNNPEGQKLQQQATQPGRSFESVLRGTSDQTATPGVTPISGAKLEQMRIELTQRIGALDPGTSKINALLPELIDTRTRMGLLKEAMTSVKSSPTGTDLQGRFGQIENEWNQLEGIMKSSKDLSSGELLGLQARLYQVSQHVEVLSKVVDQVTGGIKTILNTNV